MNKALEKILERLEEPKFYISCLECQYMEKCDELEETITNEKKDLCAETMRAIAKEIVQEVAKEYNNGWIPCSERLPEECTEVLVSVKEIDGSFYTRTSWVQDGVWVIKKTPLQPTVIAWMPLPEPYKESEDYRWIK